MAVVKYLLCDICQQKITGLQVCTKHVCWDCWREMKLFAMEKKKEKQHKDTDQITNGRKVT